MTKPLADRRPIIRLALSRAEVALSIGVSVSSVDQMVAEGALPPPRKWHSRKLWLVSEIETYLNELPIEGEEQPARRFGDRLLAKSAPERVYHAPIEREIRKGPGGYPIINDPTNPIKESYDRLGFDPATMGKADLHRQTDAAQERWRSSIPGTPLGKRERATLDQLAGYGVGVAVDWRKIKCGPDTEERLKARGFIETRSQTKFPDRIGSYVLMESGLKAWRGLPQDRTAS